MNFGFAVAAATILSLTITNAPARAALGDHAWSQGWGVNGVGCAVDGAGASSIAGTVNGAVDLGGGVLPGGGGDVFVAKYAADGSHVWSGIYDATSFPNVTAVACTPAGDTYVAGVLSKGGTIDFGGGPIGGSFGEMWAVHFDAVGNHVWSDTFGTGVINDVDANDSHVVFAARNTGIANFGGGDLTVSGNVQTIVAMLTPCGAHEWSTAFGDAAVQEGREVGIAANGDVVLLSSVLGTTNFGGGALTADANSDLALAKFDVSGGHVWSQLFTGQFGAFTIFNTGMDVNTSGSIVLTGEFTGSTTFGGATFVSNGLDIFVARFDGGGIHNYSAQFGGVGDQSGTVAWFDPSFNIMLAGSFLGTLDFGAGALPTPTARSAYVASIASNGTLRYAKSFGGTSSVSRVEGAAGPNGEAIFSTTSFAAIDFGGGPVTGSHFLAKLEGEETTETATPLVGAPQRDELSVYPNPFVSNATIRFGTTSGSAGPTRVRIFDAAGREVRTFEGFASGGAPQTVSWDGRSASGVGVVPGVYFVRLEAGDRSQAARVVRIR
jgi:hypothetical protein